MPSNLKVSIGQYSDKGRKETNQDFHGALIPEQPGLSLKGIAIALADGISSSAVSRVAAESATKGFLTDYYCTSDSWSVKTSAQRVIAATNSWLYAQSRQAHDYDRDRGYVCTFSVLVVKSRSAYVFHVGDSRIYQITGGSLEQLTTDHRVAVSPEQTYLSRALGMKPQIEIDYQIRQVEQGDIFVMATDGIYEHVAPDFLIQAVEEQRADLDAAAEAIVYEAFTQGSPDNLTVQIVRIDELPEGAVTEAVGQAATLPLPPLLEPRTEFEGFKIIRQIHGSSRSHIYLAVELNTEETVTIKIPSIDLRGETTYLKRFMMEEWVARRINNPHVLRPRYQDRKRDSLYIVTEFVDGQTLTQWMIDNPAPGLATVRDIVEQIAKGLQAFHRMEMLHQDVRPENIMIDKTGTVKIIDFGSTKVTGVIEATPSIDANDILGTAQYTAPEYFLGEGGSVRSDLFSLGVITYQMLTGRLPYGAYMAQARTKAQQMKLSYQSVLENNREIPAWVDGVLKKSVHPDPYKRYEEFSEFIYDLRHPNQKFLNGADKPLLERNPVLFWKALSLLLAALVVVLLVS